MWHIIKNVATNKTKQTDIKKHPMSEIAFMQQEIILPIKNRFLVQRFNVDKNSLYGKEIYFKKGELNGTR